VEKAKGMLVHLGPRIRSTVQNTEIIKLRIDPFGLEPGRRELNSGRLLPETPEYVVYRLFLCSRPPLGRIAAPMKTGNHYQGFIFNDKEQRINDAEH
jgi:hypothetical protein